MLEEALEKLALFQVRRYREIVLASILFTLVMALFASQIRFEHDISDMLPEDFEPFLVWEDVSYELGGFSTNFVIVTFQSEYGDVRDPELLKSLERLEKKLMEEAEIFEVLSFSDLVREIYGEIPEDKELIVRLSEIGVSQGMISRDYRTAILVFKGDVPKEREKRRDFVQRVRKDIEEVSFPEGVSTYLTGTDVQSEDVLERLFRDLKVTTLLSVLIISILLVVFFLSTRGLIPVISVIMALTWTLGLLSLMGGSLKIQTAAVGSLVIGLGVEYGVFVNSRFREELLKGKSREEALVNSVSKVGRGILGSSSTTMAGFLALLSGKMPPLRELGMIISAGIFLSMFSAIFVSPAFTLLWSRDVREENIRKVKVLSKFSDFLERISRFQARRPLLFMIIVFLLCSYIVSGTEKLRMETGWGKVLPDYVESQKGMEILESEFLGTESIQVAVYSEGDVRRILDYLKVLENRMRAMDWVVSVRGIADLVKSEWDWETLKPGRLLSEDFSLTVIDVNLDTGGVEDRGIQLVKEMRREIEELGEPPGVDVKLTGSLVFIEELREIMERDMNRVNSIGGIAISLICFLTFFSIRYGFLPLIPVSLGLALTMGTLGHLGMPISMMLTGVLSMILGVGIDFGIQLTNRFREELSRGGEEVSVRTLRGVFRPMLISTITMVSGFLALLSAELELMDDLGVSLAIGVSYCFLISVLLLPPLLLIVSKTRR